MATLKQLQEKISSLQKFKVKDLEIYLDVETEAVLKLQIPSWGIYVIASDGCVLAQLESRIRQHYKMEEDQKIKDEEVNYVSNNELHNLASTSKEYESSRVRLREWYLFSANKLLVEKVTDYRLVEIVAKTITWADSEDVFRHLILFKDVLFKKPHSGVVAGLASVFSTAILPGFHNLEGKIKENSFQFEEIVTFFRKAGGTYPSSVAEFIRKIENVLK